MHCFQCWKENFRHWTCKLLVQLTTPIVSLFKFLFTCSGAKPKKEANPVFVGSSWGNCKRVYLQDMSECYCCKKLEVCKHSMNGDTVYRLFWCSDHPESKMKLFKHHFVQCFSYWCQRPPLKGQHNRKCLSIQGILKNICAKPVPYWRMYFLLHLHKSTSIQRDV